MATRPVQLRMPPLDRIFPPGVRAALLRQVALLLIGRIKRRTQAGLDVNGQPFKAYSSAYAEQRGRAGRGTRPDLWLSGAMLNAMQLVESNEKRAVIGFVGSAAQTRFQRRARPARTKSGKVTHTFGHGTAQVSNAAKAFWNDRGDGPPQRHFFGLSAEDKAFAAQYLLRELLKLAKSASR